MPPLDIKHIYIAATIQAGVMSVTRIADSAESHLQINAAQVPMASFLFLLHTKTVLWASVDLVLLNHHVGLPCLDFPKFILVSHSFL